MDLIHWGVEAARKGGVPPERVLNAFTLQQLREYLKKRKAALAHVLLNVTRFRDISVRSWSNPAGKRQRRRTTCR